jgi:cyclophilin family peptidyl-prolyl cis-trans isomerase
LARDPAVAVRRRARRALEGRPDLLARFDEPVPVAGRDAFGAELETLLERNAKRRVEGLAVETAAGRFVIDLRGTRAPINRANLVDLAQRGFYDGLSFHRVVPGFVVQGGDPRGDGYGGPGYLVPCEWSNQRYERGTVGIALAGKDTGGSQIFVAQAPQPHLDARYTVVGKVVEGMEVVDSILPGDRIIGIELLERIDTGKAVESPDPGTSP